jgi:dihydrofolate reductase
LAALSGNTLHDSFGETMISLIVAMSLNRVIGRDNAVPWRLPAELKLFKSLTMGHHIVMGRRTWESINRLLPGRTTVIVTRNPDYRVAGALVAHSLQQAIELCGNDPEIFVIGGADIFRDALPLATRIYLSVVETEIEGDTYMPEWDPSEWRETTRKTYKADEKNPLDFVFTVYERIR